MNPPRLAIVSDLHLDASNMDLVLGPSIALIAAGDIHTPDRTGIRNRFHPAVDWLARRSEDRPVFYVPGNHDYEGVIVDRALAAMRHTANGTSVHVLWNDTVDFAGIRILGTPLFSSLEKPGWELQATMDAVNTTTDLGNSWATSNRKTDARWLMEQHRQCRAFLERELARDPHVPKVVVTHWAPSWQSQSSAYSGQPAAPYWSCDCEDLVAQAAVWIHGHIHDSVNYRIGSDPQRGHVISNPRGFSRVFNLAQNARFAQPFLLDVPAPNPSVRRQREPLLRSHASF